ncbi:MAG: hypothetical protein Q9221_007848 [Calogaya cf. arnoldii]
MRTRLITASAVQEYIEEASRSDRFPFPPVASITTLHGGINYIFRLQFSSHYVTKDHLGNSISAGTAILKHAERNAALTPHISFDQDRQLCEIQALTDLPKVMDFRKTVVQLPQVFYQDVDRNVFVMEDVSLSSAEDGMIREQQRSISLKDTCRPRSPDYHNLALAEYIGFQLGSFVARLHSISPPYPKDTSMGFPLDNMGARVVCAQQAFGELVASIEGFGIDISPQRKDRLQHVMGDMTDRVLQARESLIMGDLWVGNIIAHILPSAGADSHPLRALYILDWEFFMRGAKFVDLGHFAAEAWLYDYFYPRAAGETSFPRQLTAALFRSYRDHGGRIEAQPLLIYIAGHIGCFLTYASWTKDVLLKKTAALLALDMIDMALAEEWGKLKIDPFFADLFDTGSDGS